jgi:hypothetical protein
MCTVQLTDCIDNTISRLAEPIPSGQNPSSFYIIGQSSVSRQYLVDWPSHGFVDGDATHVRRDGVETAGADDENAILLSLVSVFRKIFTQPVTLRQITEHAGPSHHVSDHLTNGREGYAPTHGDAKTNGK